jgi:hypothetical protein
VLPEQVQVHGVGRLLMFASAQPKQCALDGAPVEFEYDNRSSRLVVTLPCTNGLDHRLSVLF